MVSIYRLESIGKSSSHQALAAGGPPRGPSERWASAETVFMLSLHSCSEGTLMAQTCWRPARFQQSNSLPAEHCATVDVEYFPGDVARPVRGEEDNRKCHIVGRGDALQRNRLSQILLEPLVAEHSFV